MSVPAVRRTYGKAKLSSTPSLEGRSLLFAASSSPIPSSDLVTPPSSPITAKRKAAIEVVNDELNSDLSTIVKMDMKPKAQSTLRGFFAPLPKRKEPLRPSSSAVVSSLSSSTSAGNGESGFSNAIISQPPKPGPSKFTQLHLTHLPLLHTCHECQMSYVRGGNDEGLHEAHHTRVVRGIGWDGLGRGKGKGKEKEAGFRLVADGVVAGEKGGVKGRIVVVDGGWGGSKLSDILSTVDTVLSAPPLPPAILDQCKIFLFLTSSPPPRPSAKRPRTSDTPKTPKERVVGVVVAQGIKWAMRVLREGEEVEGGRVVDSGGGVICDPKSLPTPLGIHRLWTVPSYRGLGLGYHLLDASRKHTVYGCDFDPTKGQVAFSQPTESGRAVMEKWGKGAVRVFVDDESQL